MSRLYRTFAAPVFPQSSESGENAGAGEGNRTLVVSLGRLGRVRKTKGFRPVPDVANREQATNGTGIAAAFTADLPHAFPRLSALIILPVEN